jgi:hypothetical protein
MKLFCFGFLAFISLCINACSSGYEFWDIAAFNIESDALAEFEEIKVIYTSRGPDNNKNQDYYIHMIAVSQKTGDTVNILTTVDHGFTATDANKVFNFFGQNNPASQLLHVDAEKIKNMKNVDELNDVEIRKDIELVARDPKFDYLAINNYPTVIGYIGVVTISGE